MILIPGPLAFQRATLKSWEWPGDEAIIEALYIGLYSVWYCN